MPDEQKRRTRSRLYAWWYLLLGAGFTLLGLNYLLYRGGGWPVLLRWLVAAGFFLLAYFEFRFGAAGRK